MSTHISKDTHIHYLKLALEQARQSPPKPTNFRVGALLVSFPPSSSPQTLSSGYTLELPGNTHAEQCALSKLASSHSKSEADVSSILTPQSNTVLYTTLEPCGKRLSGNLPCVARVILTRASDPAAGIRKVIFGAKEPGTFVQDSPSCRLLTEAGIEWDYIPDLEEEILAVAMEGHTNHAGAESYENKSAENAIAQGQNIQVGQAQVEGDSRGHAGAESYENKSAEHAVAQGQNMQVGQEQVGQGTSVDEISPEERKKQEAQPRNPKKRMMEGAHP